MRRLAAILVTAALAASSYAYASDDSREYGEHRGKSDREKSEIYGVVKEMPKERLGIWKVGDRKVMVDKTTYIDEKHGTLKTGCTVEVKGSVKDDVLKAYKVEVKR